MEEGKNDRDAPILAKICKILSRIVEDGLSPKEYAPLLEEIASLANKLSGPQRGAFLKLVPPQSDAFRHFVERLLTIRSEVERNAPTEPRLNAYRDFMKRLATRQGTILPDFETLFDRKADLDAKFFGPGLSGEQSP